jgi:hypothetical protein
VERCLACEAEVVVTPVSRTGVACIPRDGERGYAVTESRASLELPTVWPELQQYWVLGIQLRLAR